MANEFWNSYRAASTAYGTGGSTAGRTVSPSAYNQTITQMADIRQKYDQETMRSEDKRRVALEKIQAERQKFLNEKALNPVITKTIQDYAASIEEEAAGSGKQTSIRIVIQKIESEIKTKNLGSGEYGQEDAIRIALAHLDAAVQANKAALERRVEDQFSYASVDKAIKESANLPDGDVQKFYLENYRPMSDSDIESAVDAYGQERTAELDRYEKMLVGPGGSSGYGGYAGPGSMEEAYRVGTLTGAFMPTTWRTVSPRLARIQRRTERFNERARVARAARGVPTEEAVVGPEPTTRWGGLGDPWTTILSNVERAEQAEAGLPQEGYPVSPLTQEEIAQNELMAARAASGRNIPGTPTYERPTVGPGADLYRETVEQEEGDRTLYQETVEQEAFERAKREAGDLPPSEFYADERPRVGSGTLDLGAVEEQAAFERAEREAGRLPPSKFYDYGPPTVGPGTFDVKDVEEQAAFERAEREAGRLDQVDDELVPAEYSEFSGNMFDDFIGRANSAASRLEYGLKNNDQESTKLGYRELGDLLSMLNRLPPEVGTSLEAGFGPGFTKWFEDAWDGAPGSGDERIQGTIGQLNDLSRMASNASGNPELRGLGELGPIYYAMTEKIRGLASETETQRAEGNTDIADEFQRKLDQYMKRADGFLSQIGDNELGDDGAALVGFINNYWETGPSQAFNEEIVLYRDALLDALDSPERMSDVQQRSELAALTVAGPPLLDVREETTQQELENAIRMNRELDDLATRRGPDLGPAPTQLPAGRGQLQAPEGMTPEQRARWLQSVEEGGLPANRQMDFGETTIPRVSRSQTDEDAMQQQLSAAATGQPFATTQTASSAADLIRQKSVDVKDFQSNPTQYGFRDTILNTLSKSAKDVMKDRGDIIWDAVLNESQQSGTGTLIDPNLVAAMIAVESRGNQDAISHAGAAGISQFTSATARSSGLRVDEEVDERFDPEKAIPAMVRHLRQLHDETGATGEDLVARYNLSPRGVSKAMGGGELPTETQEYIPQVTHAYQSLTGDSEARPHVFGAVYGLGPTTQESG